MTKTINLGIQVVPLRYNGDKFAVIDSAIHIIQKSGYKHTVTPFETVIEGPEDELYELIKEIRNACYNNGCLELIINMRTHSATDKDIFMIDKTEKFE